MAFEIDGFAYSLEAAADLSAGQHHLVVANSSAQLALAGAGAVAVGVLQNKPNAQGVAGSVHQTGISKVVAGAFPLDADSVRTVLDERFGASSLADRSRFFDLNRLEEIASQNTVAGHVARLGIRAVEEADDNAERRTAEQGLRLALRVMEVS